MLAFLNNKPRVSRRAEDGWPPYSSDLNPLDFFFWGYAMAEVFRQKPSKIEELKQGVEDLAADLSSEIICCVMANFRR